MGAIKTATVLEYKKDIYKRGDLVQIITNDYKKIIGRITTLTPNKIIIDVSTKYKRDAKRIDTYMIKTIKIVMGESLK
jgi:hypothetical protein